MPALKYAVNCSILFTELPLLERARAARAAGFTAVEFWWPFDSPTPSSSEIARFIDSILSAEVKLVALNTYAGDMSAGERGVLSHPHRHAELAQSLPALIEIAQATGVRKFNALYGLPNANDAAANEAQLPDAALAGLELVSAALAPFSGQVLLEAVSGIAGFKLKTFRDCHELQQKAYASGITNVGILADFYHLANNGEDLTQLLRNKLDQISHIQIADAPGRHEPGTGKLPLLELLHQCADGGYCGWVGLEFSPSSTSSFALEATRKKLGI